MITSQQDSSQGQFTVEEFDSLQKTIESRKALMKYLGKYGRQGNLMIYFFGYTLMCLNKTQERNEQKAASFSFPKKVTSELQRYNSYSDCF